MFITLLSVLFIALKLMGVITWSWWLVLAPIWGGLALAIIALVGYFGIFYKKRKI